MMKTYSIMIVDMICSLLVGSLAYILMDMSKGEFLIITLLIFNLLRNITHKHDLLDKKV